MKPDVKPWIPIVSGPLVFLMNLQANFTAVPWVCATGNYWLLHTIHVITLAFVGWTGWLAHRLWQESGGGSSDESSDIRSREHFLALLGLMIAAFSAALLLAQWLPEFVLGACQ